MYSHFGVCPKEKVPKNLRSNIQNNSGEWNVNIGKVERWIVIQTTNRDHSPGFLHFQVSM